MHAIITQTHIDTFQRDGVVLIKALFADYVGTIRKGIETNINEPGIYASDNLNDGEAGRFFDDYCNWNRIPEFEQAVRTSPAAEVAADLMKSRTAQIFHDHVLVKEPGTSMPTPWHQDKPYYFVEGKQTVSFWSPMDHVQEASLRCVVGSHKWEKTVLPVRWQSNDDFYAGEDVYMPVPDPDREQMPVVEWEMEPGDAVAFNYGVLHGARGNNTASRRRAFSLRFVGDDARYVERAGPTSPPFPGHGMKIGDKLRDDWFPKVFTR